jgi:arginyl-tRNA synthetase
MRKILTELMRQGLHESGIQADTILFDFPQERTQGDIATNAALMYAKQIGKKPLDLALELVEFLANHQPPEVQKVEVAGPGFINFFFTPQYFAAHTAAIRDEKERYGSGTIWQGKKVIVEYTDPNPFKVFHIGHLMANTIGEALSRLIEKNGAEVKRVNYQGDVGRHVALTIWGIRFMDTMFPDESVPLIQRIEYLGEAYARGSRTFYADEQKYMAEVQEINKRIYERSDDEINEFYDKGREWSLQYFDTLYETLGTKFDHYFFESQMADRAITIVKEFLGKGVFEESEGAIVFPGEKYNPSLHTRVFINRQGLPTYDAKDLALSFAKKEFWDADMSVIVTGNEQREYFKVMLEALRQIDPTLAEKTKHIDHGILKLPTGKMSSRTGEVVSAQSLIDMVKDAVTKRLAERDMDEATRTKSAAQIAIAALKYTILKQSPGKDVIFDLEQAISFEGDSGPYLQYTFARARSIIEKAKEQGIVAKESPEYLSSRGIERLLGAFPATVQRAAQEYAPQLVTVYLTQLAATFNGWYAEETIVDVNDQHTAAKVALTEAVMHTLSSGLAILGIQTPDKM